MKRLSAILLLLLLPAGAGFTRVRQVGNINADAGIERVTAAPDGKLYAWDKKGEVAGGWPKDFSPQNEFFPFPPRLADLDYDLQDEIIAVSQNRENNQLTLRVFKGSGLEVNGWDYRIPDGDLKETPIIADLNRDTVLDIAYATESGGVRIVSHARNFPQLADFRGVADLSSLAVGDPGNTGRDGLFVIAGNAVKQWDPFQAALRDFPVPLHQGEMVLSPAAFADTDGDGYDELILTTSGNRLLGISREGMPVLQTRPLEGETFASGVVVEDVDLDRVPEIIVLTQSQRILAFELTGVEVARWTQPLFYRQPLPTGGVVANDLYRGLFSSATGWDLFALYRNKIGGYSRIYQGEYVHSYDEEADFLFAEPVAITDVSIFPQLVTPNNDGLNDVSNLSFRLSDEALVWLEIYTQHDHFITELGAKQRLAAGEHSIPVAAVNVNGSITLKDDRPLDTGGYAVKIVAQSREGLMSSAKALLLVNGLKAEIETPAENARVFGRVTVTGTAIDPNFGEGNDNADFQAYKLYYQPGVWNVSPDEAASSGEAGSPWVPVEVPLRHQCFNNQHNEANDARFPSSNVSCRPVQHGVLGTFDATDLNATPNGDYTLLLKTLDSGGNDPSRISYDTAVILLHSAAGNDPALFGEDDIFHPDNPNNPVYRAPDIGRVGLSPRVISRQNGSTTISYLLENETSDITVDIFRLNNGVVERAVKTYQFRRIPPNPQGPDHRVVWDGTNSLGRRVDGGRYRIRITANAIDGTGSDVDETLEVEVEQGFSARDILDVQSFQAAPARFNPFNIGPNGQGERTTLSYQLSKEAEVTLEVYDAVPEAGGQLVRTIVAGRRDRGGNDLWDGAGDNGVIVPAGQNYVVRLTAVGLDIGNNERITRDLEVGVEQMRLDPQLSARLDQLEGDVGEVVASIDPLSVMRGNADFLWRAKGTGYLDVPFEYWIRAFGTEEFLRQSFRDESSEMMACYNPNNSLTWGKHSKIPYWKSHPGEREAVPFQQVWSEGYGQWGRVFQEKIHVNPYPILEIVVRADSTDGRIVFNGERIILRANEPKRFRAGAVPFINGDTVRFNYYHPGDFFDLEGNGQAVCTNIPNTGCPHLCARRGNNNDLIFVGHSASGNCNGDFPGPCGGRCFIQNGPETDGGASMPNQLHSCGRLYIASYGELRGPRSWPLPGQNAHLVSDRFALNSTVQGQPVLVRAYDGPVGSGQEDTVAGSIVVSRYELEAESVMNGRPVRLSNDGNGAILLPAVRLSRMGGTKADGRVQAQTTDNNGNPIAIFESNIHDPFLANAPFRKIRGLVAGFNRDRFMGITPPIGIYAEGYVPNHLPADVGTQIYTFSDAVRLTGWEVELRYPNISVDHPDGENPLNAGDQPLNIFALEGIDIAAPGVENGRNRNIHDNFRLRLLPEAQPKRFVKIIGSAEANYELFYYDASEADPAWHRISPATRNAVLDNVLAHWDVTKLNGRNYTLLLRAFDQGRQVFREDRFNIGIGTAVDPSQLGDNETARVCTPFRRSCLTFGPGSLPGEALVTVNAVPRDEADFELPNGVMPVGPIFDIRPDGLAIDPDHPVQLDLTFTQQEIREMFHVEDPADVVIYHLADDYQLIPMATVWVEDDGGNDDPNDDLYRFTAWLDHFSQYFLGRRDIGLFRVVLPEAGGVLRENVRIEGRLESDDPVERLGIYFTPEADPDGRILILEQNSAEFRAEWDSTGVNGPGRLDFEAEGPNGKTYHYAMPVLLDNAPGTTLLFFNGREIAAGEEPWVPPFAMIEFRSRDEQGDVARVEYALDGDPAMTEYLGPFAPDLVEGSHTLRFRSLDANGNWEATREVRFTVSVRGLHGGRLAISRLLNAGPVSVNPQMEYFWVGPATRLYFVGAPVTWYRLNGDYQRFEEPFTFASFSEGLYHLEFYGEDENGFRGETFVKHIIFDATPPVTTFRFEGRHLQFDERRFIVEEETRIHFTLQDGGQIPTNTPYFEYRINNGEWVRWLQVRDPILVAGEICRQWFGAAGESAGEPQNINGENLECRLEYRSADRLGNLEAPQFVVLIPDTVAPDLRVEELPVVISPNDDGRSDTAGFKFYAHDRFSNRLHVSLSLFSGDVETVVWDRRPLEGDGPMYRLEWDGRVGGALLPQNRYRMLLNVTDDRNNPVTASGELVYDLTAPSVQLLDGAVFGFSPNGDASADVLQVRYRVDDALFLEDIKVRLLVESLGGFPIQERESVVAGGIEQLLQWDGSNLASNPAFDGVYRYALVAEDPAGNIAAPVAGEADGAYREVVVDRLAPRTTLTVTTPHRVTDDLTWVGPGNSFHVEAVDPFSGSGVKNIRTALSNRLTVTIQGSAGRFAIPQPREDVEYLLRYRAEDNVGNVEEEHRRALRYDATPPAVSYVIGEPKKIGDDGFCSIIGSRTLITLEGEDGGSGLKTIHVSMRWAQVSFDYEGPFTLNGLPDGMDEITVWGEDYVGNTSPRQTFIICYNGTAPQVDLIVGDPKWEERGATYVTSRTEFSLQAPRFAWDLERMEYRLSDNEENPWLAAGAFRLPEERAYTIQWRSVDDLQNEGRWEKTVIVDNTPPEISLSLSQGAGGNVLTRETLVTLEGSDAGSGLAEIQFRAGDGAWKRYEGPFKLSGFTAGAHRIEYFGTDHLGNRSDTGHFEARLVDIAVERRDFSIPRTLAWVMGQGAIKGQTSPNREFLLQMLEEMGGYHEIVTTRDAFIAAMRSDRFTTFIFATDEGEIVWDSDVRTRRTLRELKSRIDKGEGFISLLGHVPARGEVWGEFIQNWVPKESRGVAEAVGVVPGLAERTRTYRYGDGHVVEFFANVGELAAGENGLLIHDAFSGVLQAIRPGDDRIQPSEVIDTQLVFFNSADRPAQVTVEEIFPEGSRIETAETGGEVAVANRSFTLPVPPLGEARADYLFRVPPRAGEIRIAADISSVWSDGIVDRTTHMATYQVEEDAVEELIAQERAGAGKSAAKAVSLPDDDSREAVMDLLLDKIDATPRDSREIQLRLDEAVESVQVAPLSVADSAREPAQAEPAQPEGDPVKANEPASFGSPAGGAGGGCSFGGDRSHGKEMLWLLFGLLGVITGIRICKTGFPMLVFLLFGFSLPAFADEFTPFRYHSAGNAVNTSNGTLFFTTDDINIPSRSELPLQLFRTYNSNPRKFSIEQFINMHDYPIRRDPRYIEYEDAELDLGELGTVHAESVSGETQISNHIYFVPGHEWQISWSQYVGILIMANVDATSFFHPIHVLLIRNDGSLEPFDAETGESNEKWSKKQISPPLGDVESIREVIREGGGEIVMIDGEEDKSYHFTAQGEQQILYGATNQIDPDVPITKTKTGWLVFTFKLAMIEKEGANIHLDPLQLNLNSPVQTLRHSDGRRLVRRRLNDNREVWEAPWLSGGVRQWELGFDDEKRLISFSDPEDRTTTYQYDPDAAMRCGDCPPQKRNLGWDLLRDPNKFLQINYPTGGIVRYESFARINNPEDVNSHVIVTEFPSRRNLEIIYQTYYNVVKTRTGAPPNDVEATRTIVYEADGSQTEYQFEEMFGRPLLLRQYQRANGEEIVRHFRWGIAEPQDGKSGGVSGVEYLDMQVNGSELFNIYAAAHDANGRVDSERDAARYTRRYVYDADSELPSQIHLGHLQLFYTYGGNDTCGMPIKDKWLSKIRREMVEGERRVLKPIRTYCYDFYGNVVRKFDGLPSAADSNLSVSFQDEDNPNGASRIIHDFQTGFLMSQKDKYGNKTSFSHTQSGYLSRIEHPNGSSLENEYRVEGNLRGENVIESTLYDKTTGKTIPFSRVYNGLDQLVEERWPGYNKRYHYNPSGRIESVVAEGAGEIHFDYDGFGRLLRKQISGFPEERFEYRIIFDNELNIPIQTTTLHVAGVQVKRVSQDLTGRTRKIELFENGQAVSTTEYKYNSSGELEKIITPTLGEITDVIDEDDNGTVTRTFPGGDSTVIDDSSGIGNPDSITWNGEQITMGYKPASRLLERLNFPDPARNITLGYDNNERLTIVNDPSGQTAFRYGLGGGTEVIEREIKTLKRNYNVYQMKDGFGNLTRLIYPGGLTVFYKRDLLGRVEEVRQGGENGLLLASMRYAQNGLISEITYANGLREEYGYDTGGRVIAVRLLKEEELKLDERYRYDSMGRKSETMHSDGSREEYTYDSLGRLVEVRYFESEDDPPVNTQRYEYDLEGNRIRYSDRYKTVAYIVDGASKRITGYNYKEGDRNVVEGSITYGKGNVVKIQESRSGTILFKKEFAYNTQNQLRTAIITKHGGSAPVETHYDYDYAGRRETIVEGAGNRHFIYGESLDPLVELNTRGEIERYHIYIGSKRLGTVENDTVYFHHANEMDNVLKVSNDRGDIEQSVRYDPFGNINFMSGSSVNPHLFAGKSFDETTGLICFGARYYDPVLGRFMSRDPLQQGINHYLYGNNNPILRRDTHGLFWLELASLVVAAVASYFGSKSAGKDPYVMVGATFSQNGNGGVRFTGATVEAGSNRRNGTGGKISMDSSGKPVAAGINVNGYSVGLLMPGEGRDTHELVVAGNIASINGNSLDRSSFLNPQAFYGVAIGKNGINPYLSLQNFGSNLVPDGLLAKTIQSVFGGGAESLNKAINYDPRSLFLADLKNSAEVGGLTVEASRMEGFNGEGEFEGNGSVDPYRPVLPAEQNGNVRENENANMPSAESPRNPAESSGMRENAPREKQAPGVQDQGARPSTGNRDVDTAMNADREGNDTDPILLHSGDLLVEETDLKLPGRGMDFEFKRTYRSRIEYDGPLGWGWDHSYNRRLARRDDGNIVRFDGKARFDVYERREDGTYKSPPGYFDTLTRNDDGDGDESNDTFTIRDKFGTVFEYAADGWMTSMTDRSRNTIGLTYEGQGDDRHPTIVTDTTGRRIHFTYTAGGKLETVTDYANPPRVIRFAYDARGDLVGATDPVGNTVRYAYSSGYPDDRPELNHNIVRVTDAKGQTYLENEYSIFDRVVRQRFGNEGFFDIYYNTVASSEECTEARVGEVAARTRLRDRMGNLIDYTFNCQGNMLSIARHTRGLRGEDPADFTTRFRYNAQGLVTRVEQPKGQVVEYEYDVRWNLTLKRELTPDEVRRRGADPAPDIGLKTAYTYDDTFSQIASVTDPLGRATNFEIDPAGGNILEKCHPPLDPTAPDDRICEHFTYTPQGQMETRTDGAGNVEQFFYRPQGYLERIVRDVGALPAHRNIVQIFAYNAVGNLTDYVDGAGNQHYFEVDALNRVTRERSPIPLNLQTRQFEYDANGNLTHVFGPAAVETFYTYNELDRVRTRREMLQGREIITEYQYDLNENLIRVIKPEGNSVCVEYDERDKPWRVTTGCRSPEAFTREVDYDANGNLLRARDGNGNTVHYEYNERDRLEAILDPLGNRAEFQWNELGNLTELTRREPPQGNLLPGGGAPNNPPPPPGGGQGGGNILAQTEFIYDTLNRLIRRVQHNDPENSVLRYEYDGAHRPIAETDPNGNRMEYRYDGVGRLVQKTDAGGNQWTYGRDENGNVTGITELPGNFTQTFAYDELNRLIRREDGREHKWEFGYDARGNLVWMTDPKDTAGLDSGATADNAAGNRKEYRYDSLNRLIQEIKALTDTGAGNGQVTGRVETHYRYDDNGRLARVEDANGSATVFGYDASDRQVGVELANGAVYTKQYDGHGNLVEETQPNGTRVEQTFDPANRLTDKQITHNNGGRPIHESFAYDGLSRLLSAKTHDPQTDAPTSTVEYTYDKLNRVLSETNQGQRISKAYDLAGNVTHRSLPGGREMAFVYDTLHRLDAITDGDLGELLDLAYLGADRREEERFGNGVTTTYGYDEIKRLTRMATEVAGAGPNNPAPLFSFEYGYDKAGNRLYETVTEGNVGGQGGGAPDRLSRVFTYDSLYRLVGEANGVPDPVAEVNQPGSQSFNVLNEWRLDGVDNWLERVAVIASPQGEAISRSEFNPNEVNAYTTIDGSPLVYDESGNLIEDALRRYEYNYRNLLTRVAEKGLAGAPDTEVATYGYDALGRRVWKRVPDPAGGSAEYTRYVYEGIKLIAELNARGEVQREYVYGDGLDDPIAVIARSPQGDEAIYYYHTDALGSVVALTNARGGVEERYSYDAYGMAEVTDVGGALLDASELGNPFQYTGQFFDKETGFYYYKARYYHPQLGRFLQRDPLGYVDGYNLYAYVNNNPLNWVDPLGLCSGNCPKQDNSSAGNPQNSWVGNLIGRAFEGPFNLNLGSDWTDPTLGLLNDVLNILHRAGSEALGLIGEGIHSVEELFGFTADEAFWAAQSTPFPLDDAASAALVGLSRLGRIGRAAVKSTEVSPYRVTAPGETFIRYESGNPTFTRITPSGGVTPGTFAAPASDGIVPLASRVPVYNLPSPQIPRANVITLTPPPGTPIIGPRPVIGGTGNEVIFPRGY